MGAGVEATRGRVVAALATVYLVWGSTYLAIKVAVADLPPFLLAGVRFAVAGAAMYAWAAVRHRRATGERLRPPLRQWGAATVAGGLLLVGGNGAVTVAEQHIDSGLAALLVATVPLWMALLDRLRHGRELPTAKAVGLLLGFVGVGLLVRPGGGQMAASLLVVAGAFAWAVGSLYSRGADLPRDPIASTAMQMIAGAALFLAGSTALGEPWRVDIAEVSLASVGAVAYLAVFGSVIAFTAYTWLLRSVPASTVATYAYVNPVVAVLLGWVVLGERLTLTMLIAALVVVASVALIVAPLEGRVGAAWRRIRAVPAGS